MSSPALPALARIRRDPSAAGIFLDFDGTLADIVARPEEARPVAGVLDVLPRLVASFALVALVSGRPADEVTERIAVPGLKVVGLYGLSRERDAVVQAARHGAERSAATVEGAWVEDKGVSLAIHYRQAPDPESARRRLEETLRPLAEQFGLAVLAGKRVLELAPADLPGKGDAVARRAREARLAACLYAGDDEADLDAFRALDGLASQGLTTVKVAVRANETPDELIRRADVVVERPSGLVELLADLVP